MAEIHIESEDRVEISDDVSLDINRLVSDIGGMFKSLGPPLSPECCIYMVPNRLRNVNKAAYTPHVVSIGPLHHGKQTLKKMEKHKLRYLENFLKRTANSLEYFVSTIKKSESTIRSCYAETFDHLNSDKYVQMILVDAAFIIELFIKVASKEKKDFPWLAYDIVHDLYLLENQLPFFVLEELYDLTFPSRPNYFPSFLKLTCHYFSYYNNQNKSIQQEVKHFTDLLRLFQLPDCSKIDDLHGPGELEDALDHLYSATELHDAGVKFEVSSSSACLFDIKFSDGVLTIPCLTLSDNTDSRIRNLMALEQCHYRDKTYICNYISIMDHLINTTKDVDLLVQKKIITNRLGDQRQVATLFNKLCTHIVQKRDKWYICLCKDLNAYYEVRCHRWQAILRQEYFSTPWKGASTIAAIILLVLTFIQTICSPISL